MTAGSRPGVSVVVPVFNGARFVGEALHSILGQTNQPAEVIVVDDGSTDETAEVVARFGDRVRYDLQPHRGAGAARNRGADLAAEAFLAFQDADDQWRPHKLERQLAAFAADPALDAVFCHLEQFQTPAAGDPAPRQFRFVGETMPGYAPGAMLVRTAAFRRVGPFRTDLEAGEFIEWFARAQDLGLPMTVVPEVLARRRIHDANVGVRAGDAERAAYAQIVREVLRRRRGEGDG